MKLELSWLEEGRWVRTSTHSAATFEEKGLRFAIHRPLGRNANAKLWCVTEVSQGISLLINTPGTKEDVRRAASEILARHDAAHWAAILRRFAQRPLH